MKLREVLSNYIESFSSLGTMWASPFFIIKVWNDSLANFKHGFQTIHVIFKAFARGTRNHLFLSTTCILASFKYVFQNSRIFSSYFQCCGLDQHRVFFEILDGNIEIIEDPFTDLLSDDGHPETIFPYVDDCVKNVLFWRHGGWEIGSLCFWLVEHFTKDFVTSMTCIKFTRKMNFIRIVSFVSFLI